MKVPKEYYDEVFNFDDRWGLPSACGLKIRKHDGKDYVIVTELYQENPGTSITYAGETLREQVCKAKGLDPEKIVYVECAPDTNSKLSFYDEEYYVVDFTADLQHRYHQVDKETIKKILG
ncbi:MAG: hypothetical protein II951_07350 [Bacteroidales bacterium]|jgi:hypothetical protein|nr:hypothetical protein [Bacteroidales bacterium]